VLGEYPIVYLATVTRDGTHQIVYINGEKLFADSAVQQYAFTLPVLTNWPITKVTDAPFGITAFGNEPLDTCFLVSKNYWVHVQYGVQIRWVAP